MSHVKHDVGEGGMDFMLITCRATNHREGRSDRGREAERGGERRRERRTRGESERGGGSTTRARSPTGWGAGGEETLQDLSGAIQSVTSTPYQDSRSVCIATQ